MKFEGSRKEDVFITLIDCTRAITDEMNKLVLITKPLLTDCDIKVFSTSTTYSVICTNNTQPPTSTHYYLNGNPTMKIVGYSLGFLPDDDVSSVMNTNSNNYSQKDLESIKNIYGSQIYRGPHPASIAGMVVVGLLALYIIYKTIWFLNRSVGKK